MFWQPDSSLSSSTNERSGVVVAGPGTSRTIPSIIVSEIIRAISKYAHVTRIEVDVASDNMSGLHRAPSLAAAHDVELGSNVESHRAPNNARLRAQAFRALIHSNTATAIAYAWPGINNDWIRQYLQIANAAGASTIVLCESLPKSHPAKVGALAEVMSRADRIYVGHVDDANELHAIFGSLGPIIDVHPALSLRGRHERSGDRQITTFLPRDDEEALTTVLAAFDAIPEAWIPDYRLHVVMRYSGESLPDLIASSYHADYVSLTGGDLSPNDLEQIVTSSSALSVAEPPRDSRALSTAIDSGIATVVMSASNLPAVGRGYVGGLLADVRRPASVHVAVNHALRLEELRFPSPVTWNQLARKLRPIPQETVALNILEPVVTD